MAGHRFLVSLLATTTICLVSSYRYSYPLVTLKHGGKLCGKRITVGNKIADVFLGVRYAKPPVGNLRFQKPQPLDSWSGVRWAKSFGNYCVQSKAGFGSFDQGYIGSEDCLYLDITVPHGVRSGGQKPVMIYIHGGGYVIGSGMFYVGAPLALHGDVIVVTINYRLNMFGFLYENLESGNFGLWDQRAAIKWVKDNIEEFGGDPNRITLFGESAGGASVASQMMSPHNSGLFQRGIPQSGTMYPPWGWFNTEKNRLNVVKRLMKIFRCSPTQGLFGCLRSKSTHDLWTRIGGELSEAFPNPWTPVTDGDFFSNDVEERHYNLSKRFDLLAGFNGQEGGIMLGLTIPASKSDFKAVIDDCCSMDQINAFVNQSCSSLVSQQSPELCTDFIVRTYGIDQVTNDRDRAIKFSYFLGEFHFNTDAVHMLEQHSKSMASKTYAYTVTTYVNIPTNAAPWYVPEWLKKSADHGDELAYVLGSGFITNTMPQPSPDFPDIVIAQYLRSRHYVDRSYYPISRNTMTLWSNFAKTGNPNQPHPLPVNVPMWPEFTIQQQKFMEIGDKMKIITTPEKERLDKMENILFPVRARRIASEKVSNKM